MAGAERAFTAQLARFFGGPPRVPVDIGDDAAVVDNRAARSVVCCDPVIADVHFTAKDASRLVGRKAVNRNLADLAAMGALPDWLLVSLILGERTPRTWTDGLLRGIRDAARGAGARVVGGDVAVHRGPVVVTVSAIGHLASERALVRSAARAGDTIHVSGPLGGSREGHHLRFRPPLAVGAWLAQQSGTGAAIDVSDGLLLDLATVLAASSARGRRLGAELDAAQLPIRAVARRQAAGNLGRACDAALTDGEDHELLWTQRRPLPDGGPLSQRARRPIGRIVNGKGIWLIERDGTRRRLQATGFEHAVGRH